MLLKRPGYFLMVIGLLLTLLYMTSCEFENIGPEGYGRTEMLAGSPGGYKVWQLDYYTVDGQRIYPSYCDEDNEIIFANNGDYTLDRGYDQCSAWEDNIENGRWYFTGNERYVMISVYGNRNEYEIHRLSGNRMELALYSLGNETISTFRAVY